MAHHPLFVRFGKAFQGGRFDEALGLIDELDALAPGAPQVAWHRARCLEALGRFDEIGAELDRVLAKAPDYAPALLMRARYTADGEGPDGDEAAGALTPEQALRRALGLQPDNVEALELLSGLLRYHEGEGSEAARAEAAALLDRAIRLAPARVDLLETRANALRAQAQREGPQAGLDIDCIEDAHGVLWHRPSLLNALADYERCFALDGHPRHAASMGELLLQLGRAEEAITRLDEALAALPESDAGRILVEDCRRRASQSLQAVSGTGSGSANSVQQAESSSSPPPQADGIGEVPASTRAVFSATEPAVDALREAQRRAQASAPAADPEADDELAAAVPSWAPRSDAAGRAQGGAAAVRDAADADADVDVTAASANSEPLPAESERSVVGSTAGADPAQSAPQAASSDEVDPDEADHHAADTEVADLHSDDPATAIALLALAEAREPQPAIEEVDSTRYPGYQRRFIERVGRELASLDIEYIGDGEAMGLRGLRGQPVLTRFFADEDGEVGVAAYAWRPPFPGLAAFVRLLREKRWKLTEHVECVSHFDDGTHLLTRLQQPGRFQPGGRVQCESLRPGTSYVDLVSLHLQRHAAYRAANPQATPMIAHDVEGMDLRWRAGQQARCEHRRAIGYLSEAELQAMLADIDADAALGDAVRAELDRLLQGGAAN